MRLDAGRKREMLGDASGCQWMPSYADGYSRYSRYSRFHLVVHRWRSPYLKSFGSYESNFLYDSYLDPIWLLDGVTFLPANFWGPTL